MKNESMIYGLVGLIVGVIISGFFAVLAVNNDNHTMMRMVGMRTDHTHSEQNQTADHSAMSMDEMNEQLKDLSGDAFDAAFIDMMIVHHQGAIDMAALVPNRAKHDEIKKLGQEIILAQTREINDMMSWQKQWGYVTNQSSHQMEGMMAH